MGRPWYEKSYISAEALWELLDNLSNDTDMLREEMMVDESGNKRTPSMMGDLVIIGRKEMIRRFGNYLHENEDSLREILRQWEIDAVAMDQAAAEKEGF